MHDLTLDQRRFVLQPLAQRLQFGIADFVFDSRKNLHRPFDLTLDLNGSRAILTLRQLGARMLSFATTETVVIPGLGQKLLNRMELSDRSPGCVPTPRETGPQ